MTAFLTVTTMASVLFIFVWCIIIVSYLRFRVLRPDWHAMSTFRLPGGWVSAWGTLAFFLFVVWTLIQADKTREAVAVSPIWLAALGVAWWLRSRRTARKETGDENSAAVEEM